jgi:hypothetical protein
MASPTDLVTPDNVSLELIRDIYEAAFMDVSLEDEGRGIRIKEEVLARAFLTESKERLQLGALYGVQEDAQRIDRLELANRINDKFAVVRATIDDDGDLVFDFAIILKGGVTKKAIVQATRVFLMLVPRAVNECDEDGIVD